MSALLKAFLNQEVITTLSYMGGGLGIILFALPQAMLNNFLNVVFGEDKAKSRMLKVQLGNDELSRVLQPGF
jgi:hypothetical protein